MKNNRNSNNRKVYPKGYTPTLRDFVNNVLKGRVLNADPLLNLPIKKPWKQKRRRQQTRVRL
ncbi:MAG: hypothetical protein HYW05_00150 [Candidatus Diapherotrites archaeon]|nr:hypothetical protein [Candidatus Diapherotrites archaeon]